MDLDIISQAIFWVVLLGVCFFHIWLFRHFYKNAAQSQSELDVVISGAVSGAVANFFIAITLSIFYHPYSGLLIFYGLPISIPIGIFFTYSLWKWNKKLELEAGFWGSAIIGATIGTVVALVIGGLLTVNQSKNGGFGAYFVYFALIAATSGVMADKNNQYD